MTTTALHGTTPQSPITTTTANGGPLHANPVDEVSRRVALVTAAALAAGATPAQAASLQTTVASLERANSDTVNTMGAPEKHLPQVSVSDGGGSTTIQVVVPHVMDAEKPHYIEYVWLQDVQTARVMAVKAFVPTDAAPPTLTTTSVKRGTTVRPFLYCNLHGLWQGEPISV